MDESREVKLHTELYMMGHDLKAHHLILGPILLT